MPSGPSPQSGRPSIPADQALEQKVVEIIASDLQDLLAQLDGLEVSGHKLAVARAQVIDLPMTAREKTLQVIGTPEIMFLLMLIAVYGIIAELSSPGVILPGVAGAIAVILMLYISTTLPINTAGLALVALAIALFMIDAFAPSHGVLTVGGVLSFFLGAFMLFDRTEPMLRLSLWLIVPATLVTAAFFVFVVGAGLRAQWLPHRTGMEAMMGTTGTAITDIDAQGGQISIQGEYWKASSSVAIAAGSPVRILSATGLHLSVEPLKTEEPRHE